MKEICLLVVMLWFFLLSIPSMASMQHQIPKQTLPAIVQERVDNIISCGDIECGFIAVKVNGEWSVSKVFTSNKEASISDEDFEPILDVDEKLKQLKQKNENHVLFFHNHPPSYNVSQEGERVLNKDKMAYRLSVSDLRYVHALSRSIDRKQGYHVPLTILAASQISETVPQSRR